LMPIAKVMPVLNQTLVPAFSKFQSQHDLAVRYLYKSIAITSLVLVPAIIGMACISDIFVQLVLGDHWARVALPLSLLSIMALFKIVSLFVRSVMNSMGYPDVGLKSSIISLVCMVSAVMFGVKFDVMGVVAAVFATELIGLLTIMLLSKRSINITFTGIFGGMRPALYCAAIMAVSVLAVQVLGGLSARWADLILVVGIGVFTYLISLRLLFANMLQDALLLLFGERFYQLFQK
ncbi:MAG: oligosaccharide flippase family protein, partial [Thiothrix sp.]